MNSKIDSTSESLNSAANIRGSFDNGKNQNGVINFPCKLCSRELKSRGTLKIHMKKCHKLSAHFICEVCSCKFNSQKEMLKHRNGHKDSEGKFNCERCDKKIGNYYYFVNHIKNHRGDSKCISNSFSCGECGKCFDCVDELMAHKEMEQLSLVKCVSKAPKKTYICNTCGKRFFFACLLRDHINLHTGSKPYLCQKCGKDFSQKASLKQHVRTHKEIHPFKCDDCGKGFFSRGDLKKHERMHTGERPYVCEMCGEGFSQSSHLGVHRRSHTGEKPFTCDVCGRGFSKRGDVSRHRRIHTGELPYLCQVCGKKFRQSYQCSSHVRNHHPEFHSGESMESLKTVNNPVNSEHQPLPDHSKDLQTVPDCNNHISDLSLLNHKTHFNQFYPTDCPPSSETQYNFYHPGNSLKNTYPLHHNGITSTDAVHNSFGHPHQPIQESPFCHSTDYSLGLNRMLIDSNSYIH